VLDQIASEGELQTWAKVELLASNIQGQIGSMFQSWRYEEIPLFLWPDMVKLNVCLTLASVTKGQTHDRIITVIVKLQNKLAE